MFHLRRMKVIENHPCRPQSLQSSVLDEAMMICQRERVTLQGLELKVLMSRWTSTVAVMEKECSSSNPLISERSGFAMRGRRSSARDDQALP